MNTGQLSAVAIALACLMTTASSAQQVEIPELEFPRPQELGLIWDLAESSSFNRSVQISVEHGVTKIRAVENDIKAYIEEDPHSGIKMKITKQYGPNEIETLVDEQPELYMHLKAIPTEVGDSEIEISVGVTTKFEASDADDLKERHPEAFKIYEKFTKADANVTGFPDRFRELPRVIMPRGRDGLRLQIDPRGIRIHEDADKDEEGDSEAQSERKDDKQQKKDKDT